MKRRTRWLNLVSTAFHKDMNTISDFVWGLAVVKNISRSNGDVQAGTHAATHIVLHFECNFTIPEAILLSVTTVGSTNHVGFRDPTTVVFVVAPVCTLARGRAVQRALGPELARTVARKELICDASKAVGEAMPCESSQQLITVLSAADLQIL